MAETLARYGLRRLTLWDQDIVQPHNLNNQIYGQKDIYTEKTAALHNILLNVNDEIEVTERGWCSVGEMVDGYIFLCIDNIDARRELCTKWMTNPKIKFISDARMRLTDGQIYSADWSKIKDRQQLVDTMQFTHEEATEATPVTACGTTMSVVNTPILAANIMTANFIRFIKDNEYSKLILFDSYKSEIMSL